jgi:hypothetical protein
MQTRKAIIATSLAMALLATTAQSASARGFHHRGSGRELGLVGAFVALVAAPLLILSEAGRGRQSDYDGPPSNGPPPRDYPRSNYYGPPPSNYYGPPQGYNGPPQDNYPPQSNYYSAPPRYYGPPPSNNYGPPPSNNYGPPPRYNGEQSNAPPAYEDRHAPPDDVYDGPPADNR